MNTLKGKVAIITGASKGVGKATALLLAKKGMYLVLVARSTDELTEVKSEILKDEESKCLIFIGSVSDATLANKVVKETIEAFGKIDFLINNAGYGIFKPTVEITEQDWDEMYATNTKGTFLFSKAVLPQMQQQQSGHIINIASDVARRTFENGSLYCSSKFAQDAFSMAMRKEVRKHKIKVSVVYSGLVDTYFHAEPEGDAAHAEWLTGFNMASSLHYIMEQPPNVVIDELMIHPLSQDY